MEDRFELLIVGAPKTRKRFPVRALVTFAQHIAGAVAFGLLVAGTLTLVFTLA